MVIFFVFYFQKLVFGDINKKKKFLVFLKSKTCLLVEIKKKEKKEEEVFWSKKKKILKYVVIRILNSNANSLNETDSLN